MTTEEILHKCNILRYAAMSQERKFEEENYEWELGAEIFSKLQIQLEKIICAADESKYLMGIPIRINFAYPMKINLWRKIQYEGFI